MKAFDKALETVGLVLGLALVGWLVYVGYMVERKSRTPPPDRPVEYWITQLGTPESLTAVQALGMKGPAVIPALADVLRHNASGDVRFWAAMALGLTGPGGIPVLMGAVRSDPDPNVRAVAAMALGAIPEAVPLLTRMLKDDEDPGARRVAAFALGCGGTKTSTATIALLKHASKHDGDPGVRKTAKHALVGLASSARVDPEEDSFRRAWEKGKLLGDLLGTRAKKD